MPLRADRPGGYGEHDLYIAHALPGGGWSEPRNLGPGINSAGWETVMPNQPRMYGVRLRYRFGS